MSEEMSVQRWTSSNVTPADKGGFVAYGDYLELERELAQARNVIKFAIDELEGDSRYIDLDDVRLKLIAALGS